MGGVFLIFRVRLGRVGSFLPFLASRSRHAPLTFPYALLLLLMMMMMMLLLLMMMLCTTAPGRMDMAHTHTHTQKKAFQLFAEMKGRHLVRHRDVKGLHGTWLAQKQPPNVDTYRLMILIAARSGRMDDARALFAEGQASGCDLDHNGLGTLCGSTQ